MNKNITFVFNEGRSKRLEKDNKGPKEFFYSYNFFQKDNEKTNLIELKSQKKGFFYFLFKLLRKFSRIPIYTEGLIGKDNLNTLFNSESLIATNQNLGYSLLPLLKISKNNNLKFYIFIMGFLQNKKRNILNNLMTKSLIKTATMLLFISKSELDEAKKRFPDFSEKFLYVPFCLDTKFWSPNSSKIKNKNILFVGNDSNRDFNFLLELAEEMKDFNFSIVTEKISSCKLENVNLINGNWREETLSDSEIKKLYSESFLSIIPLKNSFQPSGQSVALQSMSMKTPPIITDTKGFWDKESFINEENIFFMNSNLVDEWKDQINLIYNDDDLYNKVAAGGSNLVQNYFDIKIQYEILLKII